MKVSVFTYVYVTRKNGRLPLLRKCIESVASQNFPSYEHIIVDDGSEVDLQHHINKWGYKNIRIIKNEHTGIRFSANPIRTCLKNIRGEYAILLSSDDKQNTGCLRALSRYLDKHPKAVAVEGGHVRVNRKGRKRVVRREGSANKELIAKNTVHACACMFRSSVLKKIELPEDESGFAADYDLWLKVSEHGKIHRIPNIVLIYVNHKDATRNKTKDDKKYRAKCLNFVLGNAKKRRGLV